MMATFVVTGAAAITGSALAFLAWVEWAGATGGRRWALGALACFVLAAWGVKDMLS